ncbi:DJ-1/PfpI family protein [Vallitalea okinawensis]|uniref:DJ-1/PfpI family protein n=1 Tax=Vallitalea okinawensis TaxID=2078660 RepID=UPI000CFC0102|nr:DJ-1/PfpI family protein [Vallitalea okinawensis]
MKILMYLAQGVELIEMSAFVDVIGWHKHYLKGDINVITCGRAKEVLTTFNIPLKVDRLLNDIDVREYEALAVPGGFGDYGFYKDAYQEDVLQLIREFNAQGKIIASICVGALPLGKSGILNNRSATTYHLMGGRRQKELMQYNVTVINEPVVVDQNIITSWCPSTAIDVAFKLVEMLTTIDNVNQLKTIMGY